MQEGRDVGQKIRRGELLRLPDLEGLASSLPSGLLDRLRSARQGGAVEGEWIDKPERRRSEVHASVDARCRRVIREAGAWMRERTRVVGRQPPVLSHDPLHTLFAAPRGPRLPPPPARQL